MIMQDILDVELNNHFAEKFEGGLFINICLLQYGGEITVNKDYYTVKNGLVFMVNDGKEQFSHDSLLSIETDCMRVGKYNPEKIYKRKMKTYTRQEFCKLHKI